MVIYYGDDSDLPLDGWTVAGMVICLMIPLAMIAGGITLLVMHEKSKRPKTEIEIATDNAGITARAAAAAADKVRSATTANEEQKAALIADAADKAAKAAEAAKVVARLTSNKTEGLTGFCLANPTSATCRISKNITGPDRANEPLPPAESPATEEKNQSYLLWGILLLVFGSLLTLVCYAVHSGMSYRIGGKYLNPNGESYDDDSGFYKPNTYFIEKSKQQKYN